MKKILLIASIITSFALIFIISSSKSIATSSGTTLTASNVSTSSLDLNWTSVPPPGATSTVYDLYKDSVFFIGVATTSHSVSGLTPNTTYTFEVKAREDGSSTVLASDSISTTTLNIVIPKTIENITVSPSDMKGWSLASILTGVTSFKDDASSPIGVASLKLITDSDNDSKAGINSGLLNIPLSKIEKLSYRTKQVSAFDVTNGNATIRVWIDTNGDGAFDDQLMYEPYYNGFDGNTMPGWQTWNISPTTGKFWSNYMIDYNEHTAVNAGSYASNFTISDVLHDFPNAKITNISITMGTWNPKQIVLADYLNIVTDTHDITYDFETSSPSANTVIVSGDTATGENQLGWLFNRDISTMTPFEFNTNSASIGSGSLYVKPISTSSFDKFIGEFFALAEISKINKASVDFKVGPVSSTTPAAQFYMNVYANFGTSSPTKYYDCRYDILLPSVSNSSFTTLTFDTNQSYTVTTRGSSPYSCPTSPAKMDTLSGKSFIRAIAVTVGDTTNSDAGLDAYIDKFVFDTDTGITTYDFEPTPVIIPPAPTTGGGGGGLIFTPTTPVNTPVVITQGQVLGVSTTSTSTNTGSTTGQVLGATAFQFSKDLSMTRNSNDNEVRALQKFLNLKGYIVSELGAGSKGNETNHFGPKTKAALIKYQEANPIILTRVDILDGKGTGNFYWSTRGFVNELLLNDSTTSQALEN